MPISLSRTSVASIAFIALALTCGAMRSAAQPALLTKIEWVNQKYNDFPTTDIRNGGAFRGFMVEGAVAF